MKTRIAMLSAALVIVAAAAGCSPLDTFNAYPRIAVLDFQVAPAKAGQVNQDSLGFLKEAGMRWIAQSGRFADVLVQPDSAPDTVYVQGVVFGYRPHRRGTTALAAFTGVDVRGEAMIDYTFTDSAGNVLLRKYLHTRYMNSATDGAAEAAGYELSRLVAWHKSIAHGR